MKKTITIILIAVSISVFAQNKNKEIENINSKMEMLNKKLDNVDLTNVEQQKKIIELEGIKPAKDIYESRLNQINTNINEAKEREDRFLTYIEGFFSVVGIVILFFLGGSFFEMNKAKKKITNDFKTQLIDFKNEKNKEVKETVEQLVNDFKQELTKTTQNNKEHLTFMIGEKTWEFRLMANSNIMVVNPNKSGDAKNLDPVLKFFRGKKANIVDVPISFDEPEGISNEIKNEFDENRFNIVLLENSDGRWNLFDKNSIINAVKIAIGIPEKAMLVYFGPGKAGFFPSKLNNYYEVLIKDYASLTDSNKLNAENKVKEKIRNIVDHISFVNTPSKIYPNLIDALKYLDIINPEINV